METLSEQVIVHRCRNGDAEAFGLLARKYAGRAIGSAAVLLGNPHDAMDASQEAFVKAWRGIGKFDHKCSFYNWYSIILRNVYISRLRRKKRKTVELHDVHPADDDWNPDLLAQRNERSEQLWRAIGQLPPHYREMIVMSHFQHLSYKQIAETLGVPVGTIASRLHAARKALRIVLEPQTPADGPSASQGDEP